MFRQIGPTEIIIILAVVILLFGGKKLPELARGSGRALRIFKAETKGLMDDDEDETTTATTAAPKPLEQGQAEQTGLTEPERQTKPTD
ncbi:Sec-independent protein translocase subunit TatA [Marmoricola sp. RAF53]|uniref:Sec-independent protein translocase subunit TatA n=1 Tax=Marmoricola sp. RAF53 TaxID=3233059 RepID=UPI003F9A8617